MMVFADSDVLSSPTTSEFSGSGSGYVNSDITTEISFEGPDGLLCNLSVTTAAQCLMDIELGNISKQIISIVCKCLY